MIRPTLKVLRASKNMTMREVAKKLGISTTALTRWERGEGLTVKYLLKLLDLYEADLSEVDLSDFLCDKN